MKYCGQCINHDAIGQLCKLNLSYAAFVMLDTPANGCEGYHERERCAGESQAQSEARGPNVLYQMWQAAQGIKP